MYIYRECIHRAYQDAVAETAPLPCRGLSICLGFVRLANSIRCAYKRTTTDSKSAMPTQSTIFDTNQLERT